MRGIVSILSIALMIAPASSAVAATAGGEVSAMGVAIDILLLVASLLCFGICLKIFALLKGGELSPGWQMLSISFLIFSIAQVLSLAIELEFVALPKNASNMLQLLALFLIVLGVARIKKSLT